MKKHRWIFLIMAALLLLPVCACADEGVDDRPPALPVSPVSPVAPVSPEPSPAGAPGVPAPADVDEAPPQDPDDDIEPVAPVELSGEVVISFDYIRQSGPASNQHAVWIEDTGGNMVKTLFASRWTSTGGYRTRPDSIALWARRAGLADMASAEVDAVSGATPRAGPLSYTWDLTDMGGAAVEPGDYAFFVEGTLRWKNFVLYSGVITLGAEPATAQANAEFTLEGDGRYAALDETSGETNMIGPVTAVFTPGVD